MTIAARLTCDLLASRPTDWWEDTAIIIPKSIVGAKLQSVMTGEEARVVDGTLHVAALLAKLPATVLTN